MDSLPIFLNIKGRPCLLVGGGAVAARKVALLLECGAEIRVVAPTLGQELQVLWENKKLTWRAGFFTASDLNEVMLVIAATDNPAINHEVSLLARQRNLLVNVVDDPAMCSFTVPSIIDRSPLVAAVSTGGVSPVLARLLRARLETLIPATYGQLATLAARFRERVKEHFPHPPDRRRFWEKVLSGPIAEMVFAGQERAAWAALEQALTDTDGISPSNGEVYLIGGGPGDPDLLTFRALRLMQQADVVVHDRLVSAGVLNLVRRDAERIYVGKERDHHTVPQEGINELLVRLAREGKRVVRLKGGDPFIFGRGGEEIETLAAEGIPFQVVPGITAASGCAAYAGIPLTHRDYSQACLFVTGHTKDGRMDLNWESLVQPQQTVVFYMGLTGLPVICGELIAHGLPPDTPAALIEQGTTPHQRVHIGTVETLHGLMEGQSVQPPTLIIVGHVVKLHAQLAWFEPSSQELHG
ncbi:siroheme synthase [Gammaproteobacteria bacterium]